MSSGTPDSGDAPASSNPFAALRALRDVIVGAKAEDDAAEAGKTGGKGDTKD